MNGAIEKAKRCLKNYLMPGYRFNLTIQLTLKFTKQRPQEIIKDFPDGLDYMITGVGTGGHITGCAKIKQHYPNLKVLP
jgi:cysteine synthase A